MLISAIGKIIGEEFLKQVVATTVKKISPEIFNSHTDEYKNFINNFPELYENHFNEITKWANSIPFIGLSKPKNTESSTIELIIASDIIQYTNDNSKKISEFDLLNSSENIILVGAPGSGKTTTLKRLVLKYISEFNTFEDTGFPILIRLRDIPQDTTLLKYILSIFSIKFEDKLVKYEKIITKKRHIAPKKRDKIFFEPYDIVEKEVKIEEKLETCVGEIPIETFIVKFLNQTNCFLMLDGLDELHKSIQLSTLREIEKIGLKLNNSKILITVRKSELKKVIDNFTTFEIASLTADQINEVSKRWLKNNESFNIELQNKPYKDLVNRPIYLTFLLILFDKFSSLPMQPSEIYEDITYLVVKEWDEHRDIIRQSSYAEFNTRQKLKFLSELSYNLTYKIKQKIFTSKDFETVYFQINEKYGLPESEMTEVVSEIESHTGLIAESSFKTFEFSHLSIQEFLCAKHLVNLPYSKETINYFLEYPEPIAIAICISGEPSIWFSNLILNNSLNINNFRRNENSYHSSVYTLLNRLLGETPRFNISLELGIAFYYLFSNLYKDSNFTLLLDCWFNYKFVKESLVLAIEGATINNTFKGHYLLNKKTPTISNYFINIPQIGQLPDKYIDELVNKQLIYIENDFVKSSKK